MVSIQGGQVCVCTCAGYLHRRPPRSVKSLILPLASIEASEELTEGSNVHGVRAIIKANLRQR